MKINLRKPASFLYTGSIMDLLMSAHRRIHPKQIYRTQNEQPTRTSQTIIRASNLICKYRRNNQCRFSRAEQKTRASDKAEMVCQQG